MWHGARSLFFWMAWNHEEERRQRHACTHARTHYLPVPCARSIMIDHGGQQGCQGEVVFSHTCYENATHSAVVCCSGHRETLLLFFFFFSNVLLPFISLGCVFCLFGDMDNYPGNSLFASLCVGVVWWLVLARATVALPIRTCTRSLVFFELLSVWVEASGLLSLDARTYSREWCTCIQHSTSSMEWCTLFFFSDNFVLRFTTTSSAVWVFGVVPRCLPPPVGMFAHAVCSSWAARERGSGGRTWWQQGTRGASISVCGTR